MRQEREGNTTSFTRRLVGWLSLGLGLLLGLIFGCCSLTCVPAGHVGVPTLFGRVTQDSLSEGIHVINPFKAVEKMSLRTREIKEKATVPSQEGLMMTLEVSLLFHLNGDHATTVYRTIGPYYSEVVVEPTLRSVLRAVTSAHPANSLYSGERELVAAQIQSELTGELAKRGITIERMLLRDVQLPGPVAASIQQKQQAEQEALAMQFRLNKEKQEAERKRIEAAGIRDFQKIVAQGISPDLLVWKGIEATEILAKSQNAKVVVIGGGKNGLPLILSQ